MILCSANYRVCLRTHALSFALRTVFCLSLRYDIDKVDRRYVHGRAEVSMASDLLPQLAFCLELESSEVDICHGIDSRPRLA